MDTTVASTIANYNKGCAKTSDLFFTKSVKSINDQTNDNGPKYQTEVTLQCVEQCEDVEVLKKKVFTSPHELHLGLIVG